MFAGRSYSTGLQFMPVNNSRALGANQYEAQMEHAKQLRLRSSMETNKSDATCLCMRTGFGSDWRGSFLDTILFGL